MLDPRLTDLICWLESQDRTGLGPRRFEWSNAVKETDLQSLKRDIEIAELRAKLFNP